MYQQDLNRYLGLHPEAVMLRKRNINLDERDFVNVGVHYRNAGINILARTLGEVVNKQV